MKIRPGSRLRSAVCTTEIVVVRPPHPGRVLGCGGKPMLTIDQSGEPGAPVESSLAGTLLGKRYVDLADSVEVLCTKPGAGSLALDGEPLVVKEPKPLPASD